MNHYTTKKIDDKYYIFQNRDDDAPIIVINNPDQVMGDIIKADDINPDTATYAWMRDASAKKEKDNDNFTFASDKCEKMTFNEWDSARMSFFDAYWTYDKDKIERASDISKLSATIYKTLEVASNFSKACNTLMKSNTLENLHTYEYCTYYTEWYSNERLNAILQKITGENWNVNSALADHQRMLQEIATITENLPSDVSYDYSAVISEIKKIGEKYGDKEIFIMESTDHKGETGFWNANVEIRVGNDTRHLNEVDKKTQDEILSLILAGTDTVYDIIIGNGTRRVGDYWSLSGNFTLDGEDVPFYELSDNTQEMIVNAMKNGSYSGELNETNGKTYALSAESLVLDGDYVTGVLVAIDINNNNNKKTVGFEYNTETGNYLLHKYPRVWGLKSAYEIEPDPIFTKSENINTIAGFIKTEAEDFKADELDKRTEMPAKKTLSDVKKSVAEKKSENGNAGPAKNKANGR